VNLPTSMQTWRIALLAATIALCSCGGADGGGSSSSVASTAAAPRPVTQSDLDIARSIYSGAARTPANFYRDSEPSGHGYVSTMHLKNSDIEASGAAAPPQRLHELCTNDWNEALAWSEEAAHRTSPYADLVETNEDARYFEFGRARGGEPQFYLRARVFKCAYLDRSAADLRAATGPAGRLNQRPLTAAELQTLSEYLWQFTLYNNFGHVVLKSSGDSTSARLSHTLHLASLARGGVSAACDRISVIAWRHDLNAATGAVELNLETLWTFGARENAGVAELCSA
jgi:hypothetical protein